MAERPQRLVAHTPPPGGGEWHYLDDHLLAVANMAASFAEPFGGEDLAWWAGIYHDLGKAHPDFQAYLWKCFLEPDRKHHTVDHKMAGTLKIREVAGDTLTFVINGHHGGLPDEGALTDKVRTTIAGDMERIHSASERIAPLMLENQRPAGIGIEVSGPDWLREDNLEMDFLLRMIFSTLVDADALDTEAHWNRHSTEVRAVDTPTLDMLWERYARTREQHHAQVQQTGFANSLVNQLRNNILVHALSLTDRPNGFFRLTVPTGGGKTLTGLAFALQHALVNKQARIIVAVPYITITEQTTRVFRTTLGDDGAILEHHSGTDSKSSDEQGGESRDETWRKLTSQNWDAPVIVTTTVQLFESLFSNRTSKTRKLHNIANSVILLDEVQTLPADKRGPIFDVLRELVAHYGVSVVLTTATQPVLDTIEHDLKEPIIELAPEPEQLFKALKRVEYSWPCLEETWPWERVAEEMQVHRQVLVVVNRIADAADLFATLNDDDAFHLSTRMCGAHRRDVLDEIRRRLDATEPCRLISTQLVEAGVDIDFPVVFRAIGPLDRIFQAAGRCNREGRLDGLGQVVVFSTENDDKMPPGTYLRGAQEALAMLREGSVDPQHPATMERYFRYLYQLESADRKNIQKDREGLNFQMVNDHFQMIEDNTISVLVNYLGLDGSGISDLASLVTSLQRSKTGKGPPIRKLMQLAQPRIVSCNAWRKGEYEANGTISEIVPGLWLWNGSYDPKVGIRDNRLEPEGLFS